jgi:hypothetical protein
MTGSCNVCHHDGTIYAEHDAETGEIIPFCPVCLSEDVNTDTDIESSKVGR